MESVLYLQKADVIDQHRAMVQARLDASYPGIQITYASDANSIPETEFPIVIAPTLPWLPQALEKTSGLKWVHFLSSGVEKIWDMPFDWSQIEITKSTGIHGPQISEFVIGAMLHFAKRFDAFVAQSQKRDWSRYWLSELSDCHAMILGSGHIGEWVAKRCKDFDMHVTAVKRSPASVPYADLCIGNDDLMRHLKDVEYLVVCLPLTEESRGLVGKEVLSALPEGAVLIDVSRGGVVDEMSVANALSDGHLKGAALDVFEVEPLPEDSPLWSRSDVLLTPHVSGTSPRYIERALDVFLQNLDAWKARETMVTPVDKVLRY